MYTIDAYDVAEWQAKSVTKDTRTAALIVAGQLARDWPQVEVRNPNPLNPDNQPIAAWLNGRRQF